MDLFSRVFRRALPAPIPSVITTGHQVALVLEVTGCQTHVCVVCMYMCVPVRVCEAAIYLCSATSSHGGTGFKPRGWKLCGFWNPKLGNCTRSFFNFCGCNYCKASPDLGGPLLAGKPAEYCGHLVAKTKEKPHLKQVRKPRMGSSHASQLCSHSWRGS